MTSFVYDPSIVHFGKSEIIWTTASSKFVTLLTAQPTKTWDLYSSLTNQVSGGNYVAGGMVIPTLSATVVSNVTQFDGGDCAFGTNMSFSTSFATTNHGTINTAGNFNISAHDLGGTQTVTAGTLTLVWGATGIFTITAAAAS